MIGSLLAAPPARGQLQAQLQALADKKWRHPIGGHGFTLGFSTLERWYHKASAAKAGPVEVLKRKIRSDQGQHPALSAALVRQLTEQYRQHPSWSYQLHADNLAARITADPTLGSKPSYASVVRFMKRHGLIKRPRRGPVHSPGAQAAEARFAGPRGSLLREPVRQRALASGFSPRLAAGAPALGPMERPPPAGHPR